MPIAIRNGLFGAAVASVGISLPENYAINGIVMKGIFSAEAVEISSINNISRRRHKSKFLSRSFFVASVLDKAIHLVISRCSSKEMTRPYTFRIVAFVAYLKALRDRSIGHFVRHSMGIALNSPLAIHLYNDASIRGCMASHCANPVPANWRLINLLPESFFHWPRLSHLLHPHENDCLTVVWGSI